MMLFAKTKSRTKTFCKIACDIKVKLTQGCFKFANSFQCSDGDCPCAMTIVMIMIMIVIMTMMMMIMIMIIFLLMIICCLMLFSAKWSSTLSPSTPGFTCGQECARCSIMIPLLVDEENCCTSWSRPGCHLSFTFFFCLFK